MILLTIFGGWLVGAALAFAAWYAIKGWPDNRLDDFEGDEDGTELP